ncbi:hypothetical protein BDF21DRAFT_468542 [Thamnidium elegans]|nr:hypothetical protein BDF21DRAFT_468542 [Thamnidium elegans]
MAKVLKDMLYNLHKTVSNLVHGFILVGFLMSENKFSLVLCDSPMRYVTRINRIAPLFLPEEPDDINIKLLLSLKTV